MNGLLGRKLGMTQLFDDDGRVEPVTVLEVGPCWVTALRRSDRDGYEAVQLGYDPVREKVLNKPRLGHLRKAGVPPLRLLREFRCPVEGLEVGAELRVEQVFEPGQVVKVSGTSIGKGFQGTIKRHGFQRGPETHGSRNIRKPGSIGAAADPSRVFKGLRMAGRTGGRRVTQRGLRVVNVIPEDNLLLVRGSVPGPRGSYVEVRRER